jgi:hypothetical protein
MMAQHKKLAKTYICKRAVDGLVLPLVERLNELLFSLKYGRVCKWRVKEGKRGGGRGAVAENGRVSGWREKTRKQIGRGGNNNIYFIIITEYSVTKFTHTKNEHEP